MKLFRRPLRTEGDALYGKRFLRSWGRIEPENITRVRVYGWNNPFLKIWTRQGSFIVGARSKEYERVVEYIERHTGFQLSGTFTHRYNIFLYRLPISNIVKSRLGYALIGVFCLLVAGLLASWVVAGKLVASRPQVIGAPPPDLPAKAILLESDSGSTVAGWHIPADGDQGVIVLLHGIRGSRLSMLERARMLHTGGYSIVMIDFQAHGESFGQQITIGHLEQHDVRAAVEYARERHPAEPIGIIGVSLGGASAVLASPLGIDALILESVYPDIEAAVQNRVAAKLGPLAYIPSQLLLVQLGPRLGVATSQLRPIDRMAAIGCPVFVLSGSEDLHTTAAETRRMFAVARKPKLLWLVDNAAHVDLLATSPDEYRTRVLRFFETHLQITPERIDK